MIVEIKDVEISERGVIVKWIEVGNEKTLHNMGLPLEYAENDRWMEIFEDKLEEMEKNATKANEMKMTMKKEKYIGSVFDSKQIAAKRIQAKEAKLKAAGIVDKLIK